MAPTRKDYDAYRQRQAEIGRERSVHGRDIAPIPRDKSPARRKRCAKDFRRFCQTYFPHRFNLAWGRDHLVALDSLQRVVLEGGQFALAMPRGSGKTTLSTCAALFAVLYGHRRFVVFVSSNAKTAKDKLDELIRAEIEQNELLFDDFKAACYPVRCLEGNTVRARMQTLNGELTRIQWGADELRLATVPGKPCSGAVIACAGLASGDIRGLLRYGADGKLERPDLVICDDPQTDDSARSPGQCDTREALLNGAILGLAGPGKKIAVVVPCTVIRPNDLSDRILDRKRNPEWQGQKFKLIDKMPDKIELWQQYGDLLREGMQQNPPTRRPATDFYATRRAEMDAGAELSWPARHEPDQLSAVQFALDLYLLKPAVFAAEYQNEPLDSLETNGAEPIDPSNAAEKLSQVPRSVVPVECTRLTAFLDPKHELITWTVCAWDERFGGSVIDYGTFPRQHMGRFSATDPGVPLSRAFPDVKLSLEARVYAGLSAAAEDVLGREYQRADGGTPMRIELCLLDAGLGALADLFHKWARETKYAAQVRTSKGVYVGAAKIPFNEWRHQQGDRRGPGWRMRSGGPGVGRLVTFDTNMWKSFVAERLKSPMGTAGGLTLFGSSPAAHSLFCDHLAAEHPVRLTADSGRTVDEWTANAGRPDNDYLDCLVGCAVAASVLGLRLAATPDGKPDVPKPRPKPVSYSETVKGRQQSAGAKGGTSYAEIMAKRRAAAGGGR